MSIYRFLGRRAGLVVLFCLLALLPTLSVLANNNVTQRTPFAVSLALDPSSQTVAVGDRFTIEVTASGLDNLGSFEFTLNYDPTVVEFDEASLNDTFLASSDRNFSPTAPSEGSGTLTYGAFSLGTDAGPSGSGGLAILTFTALANGQSNMQFSDPQVTDISATLQEIENMTGAEVIVGTVSSTATATQAAATATQAAATATATQAGPSITPSPTQTEATPISAAPDSINIDASASEEDINVRWDLDGPLSGELHQYNLYRSDDAQNNYTLIATPSNAQYTDSDTTLAAGRDYCYKVEALDEAGNVIGISDSDCARFGSLTIWAPDQVVDVDGSNVPVTINLTNGNGLCIRALDIELNYDQTIVQANGNILQTVFTSGYAFEANSNIPGQLKISAIIGSNECVDLHGPGRLFDVFFDVIGSSEDVSPLDFISGITATAIYDQDDLLNPVPLILQNGTLTVNSSFVRGDLNGDGVVNSVDAALALDIASEVTTPTEQQLSACDVNGDQSCNSADVSLILCFAAHQDWTRCGGAESPTRANQNPDETVNINFTQLSLTAQKLRVAVELSNASNFAGGNFDFTYDASKMSVSRVSRSSLTNGFEMQENTQQAGILQVSLASDNAIGSDGAILELEFDLNNAASSINLASVTLNDAAGRDFTTSALQRQIEVVNFPAPNPVAGGNKLYLPLVIR